LTPDIQKYRIEFGVFVVLLYLVLLLFFQGTGDEGDSIFHFLYAKYAFTHPELYLHHWAKPAFVLLASPFAQAGFIGVKILNLCLSLASVLLVYGVAKKLGYSFTLLGAVFQAFAPLAIVVAMSGLTEPLFACLCIGSLFAYLSGKKPLSMLLLSFLPFVRTEGVLFLGLIGMLALCEREWKTLLFLGIGPAIYTLAGGLFLGDFLWFFNRLPYSVETSHYGHGRIFHYVDQLFYVVGLPYYFFLVAGLLAGLSQFIQKKMNRLEFWFIYAGFLLFFSAHSLFWYLGVFDSMGLKRVLVSVLPLSSLIALNGFNWITGFWKGKKSKHRFALIVGLTTAIFPFIGSPSSIQWQALELSPRQKEIKKMAIKLKPLLSETCKISSAHPYLYFCLNTDCFDNTKSFPLTAQIEQGRRGDLLVWDSDFAVIENNISKEELIKNPRLTIVYQQKIFSDTKEFELIAFLLK